MRIKRLVIISLLLLSHTTFAAESAEECYRLPSHMEWRECLDDLADKTNALVAGAQDLVRKRISASDEEESFKSKTRALFEFSIQEFEKYKSVQCTYESSAATTGNGGEDMYLDCEISLNRAYLKRLEEQATWFEPPHA